MDEMVAKYDCLLGFHPDEPTETIVADIIGVSGGGATENGTYNTKYRGLIFSNLVLIKINPLYFVL